MAGEQDIMAWLMSAFVVVRWIECAVGSFVSVVFCAVAETSHLAQWAFSKYILIKLKVVSPAGQVVLLPVGRRIT